ncbi:MAG: hypothetical protein ACOCWS_01710 [Alkalispirochaetaceae bacterium]
MKIVVNDEAIDFTLQGEEALGEIIPTLQAWLGESEFAIASIEVDGNPLPLDDQESWRSIRLAEIDTLSVEASSVVQQQLEAIEPAVELLALMRRTVEATDQRRFGEAMTEYEYLRAALPSILSYREAEGFALRDHFDALLERCGARGGSMPEEAEKLEELRRGLDSLITLLQTRSRELVQPEGEFLSVARAIAASLGSIEEVPVLLQTGEGSEAMRRLAGFTGLLERLVYLFPLYLRASEEESTGEETFKELNGILHELVSALDEEDSVLVGDLVEYEVVPKVEEVLEGLGVTRRESPSGPQQPSP